MISIPERTLLRRRDPWMMKSWSIPAGYGRWESKIHGWKLDEDIIAIVCVIARYLSSFEEITSYTSEVHKTFARLLLFTLFFLHSQHSTYFL